MRSVPSRNWVAVGLSLTVAACGSTDSTTPLLAAVLDPAALDFGAVQIGASATQGLIVRNVNAQALELEIDVLGGSLFRPDRQVVSVPANGEQRIEVTFSPAGEGEVAGSLRLRSDALNEVVALRGEGIRARWQADMATVDFGEVAVGFSREVSVLLTHDGDRPVQAIVDGIPACSGASDAFCHQVLDGLIPPGSPLTLTLRAAPDAPGRLSAAVQIGAAALSLRAEGVAQVMQCNDLDFGAVNPRSCVERSIVCQSRVASAIRVEAPEDAPFSVRSPATFSVNADEDFEVAVQFCAADGIGEEFAAVVDIAPDVAPGQSARVIVRGSVGGADIRTSTAAIDIPIVALAFPVQVPVTIGNVGVAPLALGDPTISDPAVTFDGPRQLEPGGIETWTVTVDPSTAGLGEATITLPTNDADSPTVEWTVTFEAVEVDACQLDLTPPVLDFGHLRSYQEGTRSITVSAQGVTPCLFYGGRFDGSDAFRPSEQWPSFVFVAPDAPLTLPVVFRPSSAGSARGTVDIAVATTLPAQQVTLQAEVADTVPIAYPDLIDFGTRAIDCRAPTRTVRVHLEGEAQVTAIELTGDSGFSVLGPPLPTIMSGLAAFDVQFDPDSAGPVRGRLGIRYAPGDGRPGEIGISLQAQVSAQASVVDRFVQMERAEADVLMVLDHSGGTAAERIWVGERAPALITLAEELGIDYHFGVTTTDVDDEAGALCYFERDQEVVSAASSDPVAQLANNVTCRSDGGGSALDESPLWATQLALSDRLVTGENANFYRSEAQLAVFWFADEPEQSPLSLDYYLDHIRRLKGAARRNEVTAHALAPPPTEPCMGPGGSAQPAPRLNAAVQAFGGRRWDACDLPTDRDDEIAASLLMVDRDVFFLSSTPHPDSLQVEVDGQALPQTAWRYVAGDEPAVRILPTALPETGQTVQVTYQAACR